MSNSELDVLKRELQGSWTSLEAAQIFISKARKSGLSSEQLSELLDKVPAVRTGSTGSRCQFLHDAINRIREDRARATTENLRSAGRGVVFISCGQHRAEEQELGRQIARLVEELTPFQPFFAQSVSSVGALSESILQSLHDADGFICVMHHRGEVKRPDGSTALTRGSVWIEQEIAIAHFIQQIIGRRLQVAAFEEDGLGREGIRDLIHLNPTSFSTSDEVLQKLKLLLPTWIVPEPREYRPEKHLVPEIRVKPGPQVGGLLKSRVVVCLTNEGTKEVVDFRAEVLVPRCCVPPKTIFASSDPKLSTDAHHGIAVSGDKFRPLLPIYRGRSIETVAFDCQITEATWLVRDQLQTMELQAKIFFEDMEPQEAALSVGEIGLDRYIPDPIQVANPSRRRTNACCSSSTRAGELQRGGSKKRSKRPQTGARTAS